MSIGIRTAIVSGAGSGIGRAVATTLAELGARVAVLGRDRAKLEETVKLMNGSDPARHLVCPCDVADRAATDATLSKILNAFQDVDVLVCNAGTNVPQRSLEKLAPEDWDRMIATNLTGAYNLTRGVLPNMRSRGQGLIIQIASIAALRASVLGGSAYTASKFGQAGFGMCVAREEGPKGVRSTVIYPGEVNTPILEARPVPVPAARREAILQPEDVAAAVRFLVELNPRAHVPELTIKPTVDDFA